MISDFQTNTVYLSELLETECPNSHKQIVSELTRNGIKTEFLQNTNDIWARDYMPIQIAENKFIEYRYDPNYLQGSEKGNRNLKTYPDLVCESLGLKTKKSDIILDGGNVVKSSNSIILTDKVVIENHCKYSKTELINKLIETFEVEKVVLIPWDKYEEYGHSDGVLKFIDDKTVLISETYEKDQRLLYSLKTNGFNFEVLKVKLKRAHKWNWAYINFLQTKDIILLPKFNIEEDQKAFEQISKFYPEYAELNRIVQIELSEVVKGGGALNCISWTVKE